MSHDTFFANIGFVLVKGVVGILVGSEALVVDVLRSPTDTASLGANYASGLSRGSPSDLLE